MKFLYSIQVGRRVRLAGILLLSCLLFSSYVFGQQTYVGRWDAFGGYSNIQTPNIDLMEHGFNGQFAFQPAYWLTLGFDYTVTTGRNTLDPGMLVPSLATQLGEQLGALENVGLVPAGYKLAVPVNIRTQTFQVGPDIPFRHFQSVTFFVRPNLGALQGVATPRPGDPISSAIVAQLTPTGKKTDWTYFYGFGGGFEANVSHHFALRFQADYAREQMFNDILKAGNVIRFSCGPAFQWGKNVAGR
jgi:hypothetical protein